MKTRLRLLAEKLRLPAAAQRERERDRAGLPGGDPGIEPAIDAAIEWLCLAQDRSASQDGGVSRAYSLVKGWASSYPETTGYIVPTLLEQAQRTGSQELRKRAARMLDWLVRIQLPQGAFQGGVVDATPVVPVSFNTGQILLGLASGQQHLGEYERALRRAADWLVEAQSSDGCWRTYPSPFTAPGEKTYDTHIAWGLLEAAKLYPEAPYAETALANIDWAIRHQLENGWFDKCCLNNDSAPLTHTIGYTLRGVIEGYLSSREDRLLDSARRTADGVLSAMGVDGFLPGRLRADWSGAETWACLTGTIQIAHCWLLLFDETQEARYRDGAFAANRFVRRSVRLDAPAELRGAVKGSFPVDGEYCRFEFPNWATKFLVDSLVAESRCRGLLERSREASEIQSSGLRTSTPAG